MADDARPPFLSRAEWLRLTEEGKDVGAPLSSPEDPINERARIRLESVRDFVLIEGGRLIALPDVSDAQREIISANVGLLDVRIAELLEHVGSLESSYLRLRLFKAVEGAILGAFQIATKGESAKAMERAIEEALEKNRKKTEAGRKTSQKRVEARRDLLRPYVLEQVRENPTHDATQIRKTLLSVSAKGRKDLSEALRDVGRTQQKSDIDAIMAELAEARSPD